MLALGDDQRLALFVLIDRLEQLGCRSVLVGGLVPPLLLAALDPDGVQEHPEPRRTGDADLAVDLAVSDAAQRNHEVEAILGALGWTRDHRANQFRWTHACRLHLDLMPVPVGIETRDHEALAFARTALKVVDDPPRFYRGYELALAEPVIVPIGRDQPAIGTIRIAGLVAFLAMKLEAWFDSYFDRRRDAYDVAWLLRFVPTERAANELRRAIGSRPDLVTEIIERLRTHFAGSEHPGVTQYVREAFSYLGEDDHESDRHAVAAAVQRLLAALAL